ncbi:MAG: ATP-dependent sacrificial sulfur transferase LarE [Methanotrichaceae archaeon]|nr:ATP-dependent sacrificial sulfur transferase LarE [Methanotrichaceae archaeon]
MSDKLEDLKKEIMKKEKILVAFSGGVDSSVLAKISKDELGQNALCIILDSEILPRSELKHAEEVARSLGLNYEIAKYSIIANGEFVQNDPMRCYRCKKVSSKVLRNIADESGIAFIADGLNLSDNEDYRPGIKACAEEGMWHPFVDAGISKEDIREIALKLGLPFWNRPSNACLASRIPYFDQITEENLRMVEEAEDYLRSLGLDQLRVRAHGHLARIEILDEDIKRISNSRQEIAKKLKAIGFEYITLDLEGFRSGRMNEILGTVETY